MSRKKPSGGELQTAANRQAILPAQANPKEKINEWLYQEGIPRRLLEGREGTGRKAQRQHRSYSLQKD